MHLCMQCWKQKNDINRILFEHYEEKIYRKLKMNVYTNTQKSEDKMITNFMNKFGDPKDCLIIMGDYSKDHNMKGKEPTICKKIRKLLRKRGYTVYMINEFNTSKLCHSCNEETENFKVRKSKKPKTLGQKQLVWGLKRCRNLKCNLIHNRDVNACKNMQKIVRSIMRGHGRPKKFERDKEDKNFIRVI